MQAQYIQKICERYQVEYLGIDTTGAGIAVAEHVKAFYPNYTPINYSIEVKTRMAMRAKELFERRKLHFDAGYIDIVKAFIAIKKQVTNGGGRMTFVSKRSQETGHSDVAWAIMHAIDNAPLASTENVTAATKSLPALLDTGAATLELMDSASIRVGQGFDKVPQAITGFDADKQAALLIEYHADAEEELREKEGKGSQLLRELPLQSPAAFSADAASRNTAWSFRKGLYAQVAALLGALTAAHAAVAAPFVAAVAATALLTVASERVGGLGPGSFRVGLLDALDAVTPTEVGSGVQLT